MKVVHAWTPLMPSKPPVMIHSQLPVARLLLASRVACVSTRLGDFVEDDDIWSKICSKELDVTVPLDPYGNSCISLKKLPQHLVKVPAKLTLRRWPNQSRRWYQ